MNPNVFRTVCVGLAGLSAGACAVDARGLKAEGAFTRSLPVSGPVDLDVRTGSGTIQVRTGSSETVEVRGRIRCWNIWSGSSAEDCVRRIEADPPVTQSGNLIRLAGRPSAWDSENASIAYEVVVPPDTRVLARSGSGDQFVGRVGRAVDAASGSGDIRVEPVGGDVRASTGSGRIELEGSGGSVVARSGSGSIKATAVKGDLDVHTGSGRVWVTKGAQGRTVVTTGSGNITVADATGTLRLRAASGDVAVDGEPSGSWNVSTASGSVTLSLPRDARFDLDAHSNSGRLDSDHPITVLGSLSRHQLRGQVRGGGPRIDLSTASGAIRIR